MSRRFPEVKMRYNQSDRRRAAQSPPEAPSSSFPWKCPIAFPRKKLYNVNKTTKKAGRKGVTSTRPALCRRIHLSHTADITAPVFHYTPFYAFSQEGGMRLCVCSGVGNCNPCAAFVVSRERPRGPGKEVPPPKAEPLRTTAASAARGRNSSSFSRQDLVKNSRKGDKIYKKSR